jgi:hypothetical protein
MTTSLFGIAVLLNSDVIYPYNINALMLIWAFEQHPNLGTEKKHTLQAQLFDIIFVIFSQKYLQYTINVL